MTREEREAFLADVHVGVVGIERPGRAPLTVPIWYVYQPEGDLWIVIETGSLKERLLKEAGRFTLCAQSEAPPYRFVSVEGPIVAFEPSVIERDETSMAERYLGRELGAEYIRAILADPTNRPGIVVKMRPEKWIASDFAKQFGTPSTD
jgi:nitroimidazol reductase NimA-like FMN-containing flavoprotein (pyridoxamine 5'-phosphate oxidase superfamily)